jgi:hypothetical protein
MSMQGMCAANQLHAVDEGASVAAGGREMPVGTISAIKPAEAFDLRTRLCKEVVT